MARILLFPAGVRHVLAHVGGCIAVGRELRRRGHDVVLAYDGSFPTVVEKSGLSVEPALALELSRGGSRSLARYFRTVEEFDEFVQADLELIERVQPDATLIDTRFSARLACELAGIDTVEISYFLLSTPWFREPNPWSRRRRWLSRPLRAPAYLRRRLQRDVSGIRQLWRIYNETRALHGLEPAGFHDMSCVACPTTPLLDPTVGLPPHWHYVGPITWSAPGDRELPPPSDRPVVYVTQGSTGSPDVLKRVVRDLAREPLDVLVTTAGHCDPAELEQLAANVTAARLLPSRLCMERASVAVIHGGSLTSFDAHIAGTPVVVIPHDYDQWLWADRVERLVTGVSVRPPYLPGQIRRAVRRVLGDDSYRKAAAVVAEDLRAWDGPRATADLIEKLL